MAYLARKSFQGRLTKRGVEYILGHFEQETDASFRDYQLNSITFTDGLTLEFPKIDEILDYLDEDYQAASISVDYRSDNSSMAGLYRVYMSHRIDNHTLGKVHVVSVDFTCAKKNEMMQCINWLQDNVEEIFELDGDGTLPDYLTA